MDRSKQRCAPTAAPAGPNTHVLRRPTLAAAPLLVLALMGASLALWLVLWAAAHPDSLGAGFWIPLIIASVFAVGAFSASRGCYVTLSETTVRDVVCWIPIARINRGAINTVRVRTGAWRVFEVTMDDGSVRVLLGASPSQFPARLTAAAQAQDRADVELILGSD